MTIYVLTKNTVSVDCLNWGHLKIDPSNPGIDSDPEQLGIYTSEEDAIKALKRCTASIEWRSGFAMPFVEAEWHEVIAYSCDDAESADECYENGDCELINSNTCPTVINISSSSSIEWNGRRWVQVQNDDKAEVDKLDKIMNPVVHPARPSISLSEYIEKYNPNVKRWTSKNGTDMVAAEVLHNVLDEMADTIEQPERYACRKMLYLRMAET